MQTLSRHRLNDQVADRLRRMILAGEIRPGTRMVQTEWAETLGVSRMPVRDAFLRLQAEGVLTSIENGAATVTALTEEDIRDTLTIAAVAGGVAARRSAERMSARDRQAMRALHEDLIRATKVDDTASAARVDHEFHRQFSVQCGSERLIGIMRVLTVGTAYWGARGNRDWLKLCIERHSQILEHLERNEAEDVGRIVQLHIEEAADVIIHSLKDQRYFPLEPS